MLKRFISYSFLLLVVSNILLLVLNLTGLTKIDLDNMRMAISDKNDIVVVNSITISISGAFLFLFCISRLFFFELHSGSKKITRKLTQIILIALGLTNLVLGASRGPLFTTICISLFLYFFYMFKNNTFLKPLIFGAVLTFFAIFFFNSQNSNILIFNRAISFFEERQNNIEEERDLEFASAMNQFFSSPIIGDKIVTNNSNWFPHNIIIESLMSTGIIGTTFLILIIIFCFNQCKNILYKHINYPFFLIVIFFVLFSSSLISGSIPLSSSFWIIVSVLLTIKFDKRSRDIRSY
jgi:O-antigen ligase